MSNTTDYQSFTTKSTKKAVRDKLGVGDIWANQVRCLVCNTVVRSRNRHDMRWCPCGNIAVDGGSWYLRRSGGLSGYEDVSEMYDDVVVTTEERDEV